MRLPLLLLSAAAVLAPSTGLAGQTAQKPAAAAPAAAQAAPAAAQAFDVKVARRMDVVEVKKRLDAGQKITIIDTRSKFSGPMVKGAERVSYDKLDAWAKTMPKDTLILAYCT
jgi:hypothetical protein